jgi:hypothetical protein
MALNLNSPTTFTTGVLIGDTINTPDAGTDSTPKLTKVDGFPVSASLEIQSDNGALLISRLTEGERDSMVVTDGMIVYNLTTHMFNLYENGAWILLGAGNGDVTGPPGAVPNNIATFADASGKVLQDSGVNIALVPPPLGAGFTSLNVTEVSEIDIISYKSDVGLILAHNNGLDTDSIIMGFFTDFSSPYEHTVLITDGLQKAPTTVSALLELSSDVGALLISRMHTDSRNLLDSENGMIIYNLDTNTFDVYQNGLWQSLGTGGSVTSVAAVVPGGSHGLTITGSPITGSGTFTFNLGAELQGLSQLSSAGPNLGLGGVYRTGTGTYVNRALVATANQINILNLDGILGNPTFSIADNAIMPGTHGITLPIGNVLNYPLFPHNGMIRYNTTSNQVEAYINGAWRNLFSGIVPPGTVISVGASSVSTGLTVNVTPFNPIVAAGVINIGLNAELQGLSLAATNGLVTRTGPGVYTQSTIQGTLSQITVINGNGALGSPTISIANDPIIPLNGAVTVPRGSQAQRPLLALPGMFRFNLSVSAFEGYTGTQWVAFGAGGGAPADATYVIGSANANLPNSQNLSLIIAPQIPIPTPPGSVLIKKIQIGGTGTLTGAVPGIDYVTVASFQTVQSQITTIQGQITTIQGQITALQGQVAAINLALNAPLVGVQARLAATTIVATGAAATAASAFALATTASNNLGSGQFVVKAKSSGVNGPDVQELSALGVGILFNNAFGVLSIVSPGTGFYSPGNPTFLRDTHGVTQNLFMGTPGGNATMTGGDNHGFTIGGMTNLTTGTDNTGVGFEVLRAAQTAIRCLAYGTGALFLTISSMDSMAIGTGSLEKSTANLNIAIGNNAMNQSVSATQCIGIGINCLENLDNGTGTLAIGYNAANGLLGSSSFNTIIGWAAGIFGASYNNCVALGAAALSLNTSDEMTALGAQAMQLSGSSAILGTAVGFQALKNCNAIACTAVGHSSQTANQTGNYCTSLGWQSLFSNQSGSYNTAIGLISGSLLIDGSFNTYLGSGSGTQNQFASDNVCVGFNSGQTLRGPSNVTIGSGALSSGSTIDSTATTTIGYNSAQLQTQYTGCIFLGAHADASVNNLVYACAIGFGSRVSTSNSIVLGSSGINVGLGRITAPLNQLHFAGNMQQHSIQNGYTGCDMFKGQNLVQTTGGNGIGLQIVANPAGSNPQAVSVKVQILGLTRDGTSAGFADTQTGVFFNPGANAIGAFPAITFTGSAGFTGTANWSIIGGTTLTLTVSSPITNVQWVCNFEYFYTTATTA